MSREVEGQVRKGLDLLKQWGISIALSLDQVCECAAVQQAALVCFCVAKMDKLCDSNPNPLSLYLSVSLRKLQICIAVEQVKVSLEGVVTRSDCWWQQSSHFRLKDFNFTLSGSAQGGFLSYDLLEVRLLEVSFTCIP